MQTKSFESENLALACLRQWSIYLIDVDTMFPDKLLDALVLMVSLQTPITALVPSSWSQNIYIIKEVGCDVNFVLQDKSDIILEDRRRICPSLR